MSSANMAAPMKNTLTPIFWNKTYNLLVSVSMKRTLASVIKQKQCAGGNSYQRSLLHQLVASGAVLHNVRNQIPSSWTAVKSFDRMFDRWYATALQQNCWKCGTEINPTKDQYFCGCGLIQPPLDERDLFQVVGLKEDFDVNIPDLTRRYRELQRQLHPDKFSTKSQTEKDYSALQSSNVNKAYTTLLKPLSRGLYMLEMHGVQLEEGEIQMDPVFLMEIMEINEDLADADSIEEVRKIGNANEIILKDYISKISVAFKDGDISGAKALICKLKYYANIDEKVKQVEMDNISAS